MPTKVPTWEDAIDDTPSWEDTVEESEPGLSGDFMFAPPGFDWARNRQDATTELAPPGDVTSADYDVSSAAQGGIGLQQGFHGLGEQGWSLVQAANEPIFELGPIALTPTGIQTKTQAQSRAKFARDTALQARESSQELQPLAQEVGGSQFMRTVGQAIPSVAPALAAGPAGLLAPIIAGGLQGGAATLSEAQTKFEQLPEPRGTGLFPNREFGDAIAPAALDAAQTAAITAVSGKLFGAGVEGATIPAKKAAIEKTVGSRAKEVFGETLEEGTQQFVSDYVIGGMSHNPEITFDEALKNAIEAAKAGGIVGAGVVATTAASERGTPQPPSVPRKAQAVQEEIISLPLLEEPTVVGEAPGVSAAEAEAGINERAPEADADLDIRSLAEQRPDTEESLTQPGLNAEEITAVGFFPAVSEAQGLGEQAGPPTLQDVRDKRAQDEREAKPAKPTIASSPPQSSEPTKVKNSLGDALGTTYHATPEDWAAWQDLLTKPLMEAWPAREALKNKYGGMPPQQPTVTNEKTQEEVLAPEPANVVPIEQGAESRRAVGFLPRQSEMLGLGESALPPTVETVRQQRADESRESVTAPGEKTTESRGTWFSGKNPKETARMMQARADAFLKGRTDEQAINDLTRVAAGDPTIQLDNQAYNFAIKDLLLRITKRAQTTKNAVEANEAWQQIDRLAELARRIGAEDARSLVSRNLAFKQIDWLMPVLAWRGIVQKRWQKALGLQENQTPESVVKDTMDKASEQAKQDAGKNILTRQKIADILKKVANAEGINWRELFLDNDHATQAERRKFILDQIKNDPRFDVLTPAEKLELERALSEAWEQQRMKVFRQEFGKLVRLPTVEVEKTIKEMLPEIIRQANLGTLDYQAFLDAFAKKLGLPSLDSEKAKKITELSQKAQKEPQGIRRNKVMEEMIRLLQSGSDISKWDLLRDTWYGSVLMRVGTMLNVLAGSYGTGASFAGLAALDRTLQLRPLEGMKILGQFIGGTIEGTVIAHQIALKRAYHLLPDAEQRMVNLLSGKAGARFDNLDELLRRGNPIGVLAYTRAFMTALDYIGALGTRDSQVLYGALTRGDQESLDALGKRYDKAENRRAGEQARAEMWPDASKAEVLVRKREILEEGVAEEIKERAIQVGRRAAQNAEPRGIPGFIYRLTAKLPFFARATLGLAFMRSAMNMVQNAADYMPGIGAVTAIRGKIGTLPENHPLHVFGMDIPVEERRMMLAAQVASFGIATIAAAMFLGDDDDKEDGWEISGSWRGLTPKQKSQLMEMGERPNSIRFGKNSPWISFKQMPWAPPLAIVGTMRDEERFHAKDWEGQSVMDKLIPAWLTGFMYIRDISSLSGIAGMFDGNSWSTQESPTKLTQKVTKFAAQSVGRAGAGYIPSVLKEIDELGDTTLYRPSKEEMVGWWIRNIPYARRTVGPGPALNNFGEPIQLTPPPIKSWAGFGKDNDLYNTLGQLASKGIFLPEPGNTAKIVDDDGKYREMTEDEWYQFIKVRGPIFKQGFNEGQLEWLRDADKSQVVEWLQEHNNRSNDAARKEVFPLTRIKSLRRTLPE